MPPLFVWCSKFYYHKITSKIPESDHPAVLLPSQHMVNESLIKGGRDRVSLLSFPHPSEKIPKGAFSNFIRHTEPSLAKAKVQALNRLVANKKNNAQVDVILLGGRRGIRTLERIAPLHTFQACQFNHSCTLPYINSIPEAAYCLTKVPVLKFAKTRVIVL